MCLVLFCLGEEPPEFLSRYFLCKELSDHFLKISGQLPQEAYAVISWLEGSVSFLAALITEMIRACQ